MKPKFELGDIVECVFNGCVEGETVTVRKRLFVQGVCVSVGGNGILFNYRVCENDPFKHHEHGRSYERSETQLTELEPVIQEVERNNRAFRSDGKDLTTPDAFTTAQQKSEWLKIAEAARQQWTSGGTSVSPDYQGLANIQSQQDYFTPSTNGKLPSQT